MPPLLMFYGFDWFERVFYKRFGINLWHMALSAEVSSWCNIRENMVLTVAKMRLTDFCCAGLLVVGPAMAGEAFIEFNIYFVSID
jgi:hypothetical protein